ncbi:CD2 antigen cytoplasmic tail-binding protein 2 [Chlorella vulgaris]
MMSGPRIGKRHVRFNDNLVEFGPPEPKNHRQDVDPMQALEGEINGVCLAEDPGACAARRAAARKHDLMAGFEKHGVSRPRDGDDLEGAEEDYDEPEEMWVGFNDAGLPWEPFHLKREREEGYFDEDGNYVEYKAQEVEDAWADGLANVEVDEEWLKRVMGGRHRGGGATAVDVSGADEEPQADMTAAEVSSLKHRIVDMLLPAENVLQALRRLARVRQPVGSGATAPATPAADPLTRHPWALGAEQAMPPVVRQRFQELTSLSNALMDQGVYSVHSMSREQLESSIPSSSTTQPAAAAAGSGGVPANGASSTDAGVQLAEQLLAAAGAGSGVGAADAPKNGGGGAATSSAAAMSPVAAIDAESDIFGDEPAGAEALAAAQSQEPGSSDHKQQQQQSSEAQAAPAAPGDAPGDVSMQEQQEQGQQQGDVSQQGPAAARGGSAWGAVMGATGAGPAPTPDDLDGFELDAVTGLLYSSAMGCYFDPGRGLFGDAASGLWYRFDSASGQYQLAS